MISAIEAHASPRVIGFQLAKFLSLATIFVIPLSNAATTALSVLLAVVCLFYMDRKTWGSVLRDPITIAILSFVVLTLIDSMFSMGSNKDIALAFRKATRLIYFPLLLPLFKESKMRHLACISYVCAIFISVVAALIYTWAFFKDTIFTSLFVAYAIFMLMHYGAVYKRYRIITIPLCAFFLCYLFFIGTGRSGQMLFFILLALFLFQSIKFSTKFILATIATFGILLGATLLIPSSFMERQVTAFNEINQYMHSSEADISNESSMGLRLLFARNSWELIKQKPIFGYGSGAYKEAYTEYAPEFQYRKIERANPHNQYLLTWVELGFIGLAVLLWVFFSMLKRFLSYRQLDGYLGLGLVCAMMVGCTMNSWILDFTSAFFFVFMLAVFAAGCPQNQKADV